METPVAFAWGKEEGNTGRMKKFKAHQDFICRPWLALVSLGKLEVYIGEGASVCGGWKQCLSVDIGLGRALPASNRTVSSYRMDVWGLESRQDG